MEFDKPLSDADVLENRKIYKVNVAFFLRNNFEHDYSLCINIHQ